MFMYIITGIGVIVQGYIAILTGVPYYRYRNIFIGVVQMVYMVRVTWLESHE